MVPPGGVFLHGNPDNHYSVVGRCERMEPHAPPGDAVADPAGYADDRPLLGLAGGGVYWLWRGAA